MPMVPVADSQAVVTVGHARFTVLTSRLIRLEWSADGRFEDRPSFVFLNRRLPVPVFERQAGPEGATIRTSDVSLHYAPEAGTDGRFSAANLSIRFELNGQPVDWHPGLPDADNLLGTTRTLDGARGDRTKEPMGPGLVSRSGWVVVDDSARPLFDSSDFRFAQGEASPWPWAVVRPAGERQDWYFFGYGHDYRGALGDFVRVAGRIPLPPRFAFGSWWSRYWAYSDQELDGLVRGFRENDVPLDVFVIDMDWHKTLGMHFDQLDASKHTRGWTGYSWNRLLFPDPERFLLHLHDEGLKVTLNLHPASGVQPWEDRYPEMARAMGIDPSTQQYVPFDITDRRFARNYFDILHHPLEHEGIDFWWLDWQQEPTTALADVSPTWWLNYVHFTDQEREGKRPLLFHRWGGLGNHRYEIGFSGDTISVWDSLAFQPWFTATAANVGYAYWSHDIGGHMPGKVEPELYTRWVQFGAFSPILRTHTTKNAEAERRIWAYPEPYSSIMRHAFQLRYALQPYIYTEARRTYDTGVAFLRPLYYDSPEAPEAYASKGQYAFGDSMIVAPVTAPVDAGSQLATERVWLPAGTWFEWPTGRALRGPVSLERRFSIDQTPVYIRGGSIVPMQPPMSHTGEKPVDPLILEVFPLADGQLSKYSVYEDASASEDYQKGVCAWTPVQASRRGGEVEIVIDAEQGRYPGMPASRAYEIRLPGDVPPESATVNGKPLEFDSRYGADGSPPSGPRDLGWHFEGQTLTTVLAIPRTAVGERVVVRVRRPAGRTAPGGFAGRMTRLRGAYDALNQNWPHTRSPDALIDALQSGNRLGYHPFEYEAEFAHLREVYPAAVAAVRVLVDQSNASDEVLVGKIEGLKDNWRSENGRQQAAHYREAVRRALALLEDGVEN